MNQPIPVLVERDNVNDEKVILTRWFVSNGALVETGQLIAEIETSKATVEIHSPAMGFIQYTAQEQTDIPVGEALCFIIAEATSFESSHDNVSPRSNGSNLRQRDNYVTSNLQEEHQGEAEYPVEEPRKIDVSADLGSIRFSRRAAELAKALDLAPEMFAGRTLIREKDIRLLLDGVPAEGGNHNCKQPGRTSGANAKALPALAHRVEHLPSRKRTEIRQIAIGTHNSIASSVTVACPTHGVRSALQERAALVGGSLGAIIVFEVSRLLRKYRAFNSVYRSDNICLYDQVNIGFAVDDGRGLKVPVIRECDQLALSELSARMRALTLSYVTDKLLPEDLVGATFTVSDLSALGVSHFNPLISGDQSAILGISSEVFLPGANIGLYHLTLVFDHQVSDGRTAALFLTDLRGRMESYEKALSSIEADSHLCCTRCLRSAKQLNDLGASLLRSVAPEGFICSFCILGY